MLPCLSLHLSHHAICPSTHSSILHSLFTWLRRKIPFGRTHRVRPSLSDFTQKSLAVSAAVSASFPPLAYQQGVLISNKHLSTPAPPTSFVHLSVPQPETGTCQGRNKPPWRWSAVLTGRTQLWQLAVSTTTLPHGAPCRDRCISRNDQPPGKAVESQQKAEGTAKNARCQAIAWAALSDRRTGIDPWRSQK